MKNRAAGKRLLTAVGISLAVHLAGIIILGLWSLKTPAPPKRTPPLAVYLEPEVAVQPVIKKPEKLPSVPPAAKVKALSTRKTSQPVSRPASRPVEELPSPVGQPQIQGPDTNMKISPESSEPLTAEKPKPIPKPKGNKIVYADTPSSEEPAKTPPPVVKPSSSIISSAELNAFASSIQKADASAEDRPVRELTKNTAGPAVVPLPDTVSLALGDSANTRKPVSKLALNIPEGMLQKIGHDSFLTVAFTLTPEGYILDPKVLNSQVSSQIEAKVLEALRNWEFNKGPSSDGNVEGKITVQFKVK